MVYNHSQFQRLGRDKWGEGYHPLAEDITKSLALYGLNKIIEAVVNKLTKNINYQY